MAMSAITGFLCVRYTNNPPKKKKKKKILYEARMIAPSSYLKEDLNCTIYILRIIRRNVFRIKAPYKNQVSTLSLGGRTAFPLALWNF